MLRSALTIASDFAEVGRARAWIVNLADQAGLSSREKFELQLAVSEACTNAIKHAYAMTKDHTVELSAEIDDNQIRLVIRDFGKKLDPESYQEPDLDNPGERGYGIYLLRHLMDGIKLDVSHEKGTKVTLIKRR
ncbi:MAG: ATP-binding protein [Pseudomonadota bacterium]